jgi:glycosyltransferase involved in cell wall biosynthesis
MTPRPLRVLYVMHSGVPAGSAESLCLLLESFPPGSVHATVICPPGAVMPRLRRTGATVRSIPGVSMFHSIQGVPLRGLRLLELTRTAWMTRYGGAIRAAIRETRPDIVHLNERGMIQAARIASREGVPVVLHARSVAERREGWVRRVSAAAIRRYVTRVVAIDESVRSSLAELPGVEVIYNPIDRGVSTADEPQRDTAAPVRVTFLAGLQTFKGIDDLLDSALRLRDRRDIVFQIAGSNSRPDAFHRSLRGRVLHLFGFAPDVESWIRRWIAEHGLGETVRLLGRVRPEDVLVETDILVFPSHLDGPGRSVYEAGARGIPAVVSLLHRVEDVVVHQETGLIVPERDPPALAQSIARLADDPELRRRLGENARRRYRRQFDPAVSAGRMLALYRELASPPGKGTFEPGDRSPHGTTPSTARSTK